MGKSFEKLLEETITDINATARKFAATCPDCLLLHAELQRVKMDLKAKEMELQDKTEHARRLEIEINQFQTKRKELSDVGS